MIIHTCITGFTQHVGRMNGVTRLSERLRQSGLIDCFNTRIGLYQWNVDWKKIAEHYWILSETYTQQITIVIYAYSWGAGWGAMQLAKYLNKCGLYVKVMVLCDPVYRHPNTLLRWLSLVHRDSTFSPVIKVPDNVHEIFNFNQRSNKPSGHRLIATNGTVIHPSYEIKHIAHEKMDDCWKFHAFSLEVAKRIAVNQSLSDIDIKNIDITDYIE